MYRTALFAAVLAAATLAACASTPTPTQTPVPSATPAATATTDAATVADAGTAPRKRSVWETTVGPDQMRGDCPKGSIVPPYGPVLITPKEDGGFDWKDVQNGVYTFTPNGERFTYRGPNVRKDGALTMTLAFEDAQRFRMQAEYVRTDDPACIHTYDYEGVYKFDR